MSPSSTTPLPRLLTAREVADQTGLPLSRVYELAREGDMPSARFGRALRFDARQLSEWIERGGTGYTPPAGNGANSSEAAT